MWGHTNDDGLVCIGKGIYLSKPKKRAMDSSTETGVPAPAVILLFGWMGAQLPHLLKYITVYDKLYPEAAKIVIRSEPSFFWSTKRAKRAHLTPVVEALEVLGCLPPANNQSALVQHAAIEPAIPYPTPRIIVHTFSNGGSWQLVTLSDMLAERRKYTNTLSPPAAVILDSCPGNGGVDGTLRAFTGVIRNPIGRKLARLLIRLIYIYLSFRDNIFHGHSTLERMKARLNNERLLPWFGKNTKRLYIYSIKDDIIPYHEVEGHAKQAKEWGLQVRMERFEDSAHVAHARTHPEKYWNAIRNLWEEAVTDSTEISSESKA